MALTLKRLLVYVVFAAIFLLVGNVLLMSFEHKTSVPLDASNAEIHQKLDVLIDKAKKQAAQEEDLQQELSEVQKAVKEERNAELKSEKKVSVVDTAAEDNGPNGAVVTPKGPEEADSRGDNSLADSRGDELVLPILVFSCNRASAVVKALDDLIKYRPSKEKFPIIVTQDCGHEETSQAIQKYRDVIHRHILQPDLSAIPNLDKKEKKLENYFKISRHYKWALGQVFDEMKYKAVIIMEDDLNISPDFYEYFEATHSLLVEDPTLYCVSAWNDNGKAKHIEDKEELLYRSDFMPGLGWMMLDKHWDEYRDKWPKGFWDDWIRMEAQRKGRACIRPEISRTHTFGEKGVSLGRYFNTHLKFIVLNEKPVEWTQMDLSYLKKDEYDEPFLKRVYDSPLINLNGLEQATRDKNSLSVRIQYHDKAALILIMETLDIMNDFKDGIPRTAYFGVITIFHNGIRVYITPPSDWQKYDPSWT